LKKVRRKRPKVFIPSTANHARLRRRWRSWLPTLESDISDLLGRKEIFWHLQEVAKDNPEILRNGVLFDWMCTNYIGAIAVAIRGLVDHRSDVRSLWRMLYEILERPRVINRRAHTALYRGAVSRALHLADITFDNVVGKNRDVLTQRAIRADMRRLEDASVRVRTLVNKRIAHRAAPGQLRRPPLFREVDAAMKVIDAVFCKYSLLLTAKGMDSTFATRQENWMAVLYEPWIKAGSRFHPN